MIKILGNIIQRLGYVHYTTVFINTQPLKDDMSGKIIYILRNNGLPKWIFMKCPCGCDDVLTLSLMKSFKPNWRISFDKLNRITMLPSIWKTDGCRSHFFILKSKIKWSFEKNRSQWNKASVR